MSQAKRKATYADLVKVPDGKVAEIVDGELFVSPRPASPHALAASTIGMALAPFHAPPGQAGCPGGWWILFEPELHLGDDVLVPDLAGWRRARLPVLPNVTAFTQAPDWTCEVASPATVVLDRRHKMRIYAREGIGHLWIVDPSNRSLEVHRLEGGRWVLASAHAANVPIRVEPFETLVLDPSRWWLQQAP